MIMKLEPIFKDKIWGGTRMQSVFNYHLPSKTVGECWGISGFKNESNKIINGPFKGQTLYDLWHNHRALFGYKKGEYFPLLIKIIDAQDDLSIQVHPNDQQAKAYDSLGKTECWHIIDCEEKASIIIGHKAEHLDEIKQAIEEDKVLEIVNHHPIKPGDFFFIETGTLHAIKAGTLLLEIQQSSDITFRFYDYKRLDNNKERPLHINEALDVLKVPDHAMTTKMIPTYFDARFEEVNTLKSFQAHKHGDFITVIDGKGYLNDLPVRKGDFLFIPSNTNWQANGNLTLSIAIIT